MLSKEVKAFNEAFKENNEVYYNIAKKFKMSLANFWILYLLREDGLYNQASICKSLFMNKQTVNSSIKKLLCDDLVEYYYLGSNRKNKYLRLTENGVKVCEKTIDKVYALENQIFVDNLAELEMVTSFYLSFNEKLKKGVNNL